MFDIPIVLFIFKRTKAVEIIKRISEISPSKLYIIADGGRNDAEQQECEKCRSKVLDSISWDCEVITNFSERNRGVFENIGMGAKWVFQKEESAIFLEDDNLPEISFFEYCKQLLDKYKTEDSVLWICGTNYLGEYRGSENTSYIFTRCMLPCGWASWSHKFLKYYDAFLEKLSNDEYLNNAEQTFTRKSVFRQFNHFWNAERARIEHDLKPLSWDYQMDFSVRSNCMYGISPVYNQITNIGVDDCSIHGGNSFANEMTKRFCGVPSQPLEFPLQHPKTIGIDLNYEKRIEKILEYPFSLKARNYLILKLRRIFRIPFGSSIHKEIQERFKNDEHKQK